MNPEPEISSSAEDPCLPGRLGIFRLFLIFAGLSLVLALAMSRDFRPLPIYEHVALAGDQRLALTSESDGGPLTIDFEAPGANLNGIYWGEFYSSSRQEVEVTLYNVSEDQVIGAGLVDPVSFVSSFGDGNNRPGDRLRATVRWLEDRAPRIPLLPEDGSTVEPEAAARIRIDGEEFPRLADIRLTEEKPSKTKADTTESEAVETSDWLHLERGQQVEIELTVPKEGLKVVSIPGLLADHRSKARIEVANLNTGLQLAKSVAKDGVEWEKTIGEPAAGDRLKLTLSWDAIPSPGLMVSAKEPAIPLELGGVPGENTAMPMMLALYRWRSRSVLWLWPLVGAVLFAAIRNPKLVPVFLVGLGLVASATAALRWQQQYGVFAAHTDPDHYALYADNLVLWLKAGTAEARQALGAWLDVYSNAHVPMVSLLLAVLHLCGLSLPVAYVWLCSLFAFGAVLTIFAVCRRLMNLSVAASLLTVALLCCHLAVLKSFARPTVDMAALLLTALMFHGILWRLRCATRAQTIWLAVLPLLLLLTRHGAVVYLPFHAAAVVAADWYREGTWKWWPRLIPGVLVSGPALLVYAALFAALSWLPNFYQALERNALDIRFHSPRDFAVVAVTMVQAFVFGWLLLPMRRGNGGRTSWMVVLISAAWIGYYALFLLIVQASYVQRLLLPMIPALAIGFAVGIDRLAERRPNFAAALVVAACACNVAVTIYVIYLPYLPPISISRFIY